MYLQRKQKYKQKRCNIHEVHMSMKIGITLDKKPWWLKTENIYRNIIFTNIKQSKMHLVLIVICFYFLYKLISNTLLWVDIET